MGERPYYANINFKGATQFGSMWSRYSDVNRMVKTMNSYWIGFCGGDSWEKDEETKVMAEKLMSEKLGVSESELKQMMEDPESISFEAQLHLISAHFEGNVNSILKGYMNGLQELEKGDVISAESVFNDVTKIAVEFIEQKITQKEGSDKVQEIKEEYNKKTRRILAACYGGLAKSSKKKSEPMQELFYEKLALEVNPCWTMENDGIEVTDELVKYEGQADIDTPHTVNGGDDPPHI